MVKNIGIDLGFGFVKVTDGEKDFVFPSVVGIGQALTYHSELTTYTESIDNLAVTFEGKKYFIGELAVRQSDFPTRSLGEHHVRERNTKILLLTALSLFTPGDTGDFNVVTGLAPDFYQPFKEELTQLVEGRHNITVTVDGVERPKTIVIGKVKVIPQPLGTLYQKLFDAKGDPESKELNRSKIGIIDVGFRTTDFAIVDKMEYIDKSSRSSIIGISNAYGFVAEYLRKQFRIHKENYELDNIIHEGRIKIAGKLYQLDEAIKEAYEKVAAKIIIEMNSLWDCRGLDLVLITGGGGKALADYLTVEIGTAVVVENAQTANAYGYQKMAQKTFGIA